MKTLNSTKLSKFVSISRAPFQVTTFGVQQCMNIKSTKKLCQLESSFFLGVFTSELSLEPIPMPLSLLHLPYDLKLSPTAV